MMQEVLNTKFGTARLYNNYYIITNGDNYGKKLHRLIFEDFYDFKIPKDYVIHHKNGNKLDNCILNLQLLHKAKHMSLHKKGCVLSNETKLKLSKVLKGKFVSDETKKKMKENHKGMEGISHKKETKILLSKNKSSTGIYRVTKIKDNTSKNGFRYLYQYYIGKKRYAIGSVDLDRLKKKVIEKGLEWIEFDEELKR